MDATNVKGTIESSRSNQCRTCETPRVAGRQRLATAPRELGEGLRDAHRGRVRLQQPGHDPVDLSQADRAHVVGKAVSAADDLIAKAAEKVEAKRDPALHAHKAPMGYQLRGVSTLLDRNGNVA